MYRKLTLLLVIVAIYGTTIFGVGFISDDYSLLHRAESHQFLSAMENHHYSILINTLFSGVAEGDITPAFIHIFALGFHLINCCAVLFFLEKILEIPSTQAFITSLLFAISPAGFEALIWCCAIPYIIVTTGILATLILYGLWLKRDENLQSSTRLWALPCIQLASFFIWEWALLILPLLLLMAMLFPSSIPEKKRLQFLIGTACVWVGFLLLRKVFGLNLGYHVNSIKNIIGYLIATPFVSLMPMLPKSFYCAPSGIFCSFVTFAIFSWMSVKNRTMGILFALLLVCQLPTAFFGYPQSRYLYFPSFAMYGCLVLMLSQMKRVTMLLYGAVITAYVAIAIMRVDYWKEASNVTQEIYGQVTQTLERHSSSVVILDFPDSYGPEEVIWRPYLWRCGKEIFGSQLRTKVTSGAPQYRFVKQGTGYQLVQESEGEV